MRGKPITGETAVYERRITPADAGKTDCAEKPKGAVPDHPRGCGENVIARDIGEPAQGSPPRMRGKRSRSISAVAVQGITPADAGKTLKRSFRNQPFCS